MLGRVGGTEQANNWGSTVGLDHVMVMWQLRLQRIAEHSTSFVDLLFDEENGSQIFRGGTSHAAVSRSTPCALCPVPSPRTQQRGHMESESCLPKTIKSA